MFVTLIKSWSAEDGATAIEYGLSDGKSERG